LSFGFLDDFVAKSGALLDPQSTTLFPPGLAPTRRLSLMLEISIFIKDELRIRFKILVDLFRDGALSAQRLSNFFHLLQQLLHVVLHVLQNQPEAAISLGLPYG
jgi:hypothetical protein